MEYLATINIPKSKLMKWNDLLRDGKVDYDAEKIREFETTAMWTATFADGCFADVKVNANAREDGDFYAEAVLFSPDGRQLAFTEPSYELDGSWYLYSGDRTYIVMVIWGDDA